MSAPAVIPMKPSKRPKFQSICDLRVRESGASFIELRSTNATVRLSALAADLFRIQILKNGDREWPSWAVEKTRWPEFPVRVRSTRRHSELTTSEGSLRLDCRTGAWALQDSMKWTVLAAGSEACGFTGSEARVTTLLQERERVFGLGETTGTFDKRGLVREFWNIDVLGHAPAIHPCLRSLYVSIPFALTISEGRAAGLFWDNPARQTWDIGQTSPALWRMTAGSGVIDLYLFLGPTAAKVVSRFTELTGRMPLPPLWALGYHQCRYSYESRKRVEEIAREFRRRRIPCDALYLDIHHMRGYRVFTFGRAFPKPADMIRKLASKGFKTVAIVDPGVKDDPHFPVLQRGIDAGVFVKEPSGTRDYIGDVWPGKSRFPDFFNARTRRWWSKEQARLHGAGIAGIWNDMNEPANFALPSRTLPPDARHQTDQGARPHDEVHNVYGTQMARASREGALAHAPDSRPFVITRAGYAGIQRHAMVWTGDNSSTWEHLADSVQMLLNLSVSGVPFCGADVGGFLENCTPELLVRWTQLGAFTPFFRNHSNIGTVAHEPWAFGTEVEAICRRYIELRYQLLPYLYGLFAEARRSGAPIMRPLFWHFQNDSVAVAAGDQFMLGSGLLVAPILRQGAVARSVYLPAGQWFDFWSGELVRGRQHVVAHAPLDRLPLFVRAGAIIPMWPVQQFVGERTNDAVNLHVWPPGRAEALEWYEDDGASQQYERGALLRRTIALRSRGRGHALVFSAADGQFESPFRTWRVIIRNASRELKVTVGGRRVRARFDSELRIVAFEIGNRSDSIEVVWR